ncbi:(deoxy)nucleoside triphosphate pyrophosphohydrolase [Novosphingobium sp. P6W]|uniref:(deoxy)nucleoside triphosphate pyrophosphohydrolase n=1 Tax=Novosphingobium sp. P6W TaxID=1609758 RepID=UPI0005C2C4B7|nr:(deoxy)nucleoside triphosphate pyrophosphohydrolase [Novosphingobium sp. P6W]AXB76350.1 (deoxy)nucleoside triphosphate pyrophosphohydrolase [Novosphingobium sp. P6W]KIS32148.1 DNA mismatch repair protein MutT [Novosphingobium sp. P6W]
MLVVAVALRAGDGTVLMQRRDFEAVHGGLWEFPGGKVDPGETPERAAVRELSEELGITMDIAALKAVGFASGHTVPAEQGGKGPSRPLVILLYLCRIWQGVPSALEAAELAWTAPEAISSLSMPPLDYPLAEALGRYLSAG